MKKGIFFVMVTMSAMVISCKKTTEDTSNLYIPTPSDVTSAATFDELNQGRSLYIDNCGKCHGLYDPDSFNSSQWKSIMNQMGPKTRLTTAEISLVSKYVSHGK